MKYFKKIENLPVFDIYAELTAMIKNGIVDFSQFNQISLNTLPSQPNNFKLGTGSLYYDYGSAVEVTDPDGTTRVVPPKYEVPLDEEDFTVLCDQFKGTLFEELYNAISKRYRLGRVRIMKMEPRKSMSWHTDDNIRLHFPIKTQTGCFMVIEDEVMHLPKGEWWLTDTKHYHTAFNASNEDRLHLVAVVYE